MFGIPGDQAKPDLTNGENSITHIKEVCNMKAEIIDSVSIQAAKVQAVFRSLPWPQGSSKEAAQLADMLLVLADQINMLADTVTQLEAEAGKGKVA